MERAAFVDELTDAVSRLARPHPVRVAITGPGTSGKSTLARELSARLRAVGRTVVEASIDGVYLPGRFDLTSSKPLFEQFIDDALDLDVFRRAVVARCGPGGDRAIQIPEARLDHDHIALPPPRAIPADAIVVVDGIFLLHPTLAGSWELSVWLRTDPAFCIAHGVARAQANDVAFARRVLGDADGDVTSVLRRLYEQVFLPGHAEFARRYDPEAAADWVVDHADPRRPIIVRS